MTIYIINIFKNVIPYGSLGPVLKIFSDLFYRIFPLLLLLVAFPLCMNWILQMFVSLCGSS